MSIESTNNIEASREILWNITSPLNVIIMYMLCGLSFIIFSWGIWRRIDLWASGQPDKNRLASLLKRVPLFFVDTFLQRKVNRDSTASIFHTGIFIGFITLFITTVIVFIDHDFGFPIYRGRFYLLVTLLSDLFGLALLFGLAFAFHRRVIKKPDRIHSSRADYLLLFLLGLLAVQGFALEGLRIYATNDPWALYSPVGYVVSQLLWSFSIPLVELTHFLLWWVHTVCAFLFIAILPYTKLLHIFSSSANLLFRNLSRHKGTLKYPGDIESLIESALESEDENSFQVGISNISDFSWKQLLDLDACTSCGRCQEVCPAYISGKPLSPKWLILDSKEHMLSLRAQDKFSQTSNATTSALSPTTLLNKLDRFLLKTVTLQTTPNENTTNDTNVQHRSSSNALVQNSVHKLGESTSEHLAGGVMDQDVFWSCTTCRACMEACPVDIEHVDLIVDVRRSMALMEGNVPTEAQSSLRAIETRDNPFGPSESRTDWLDGIDVPILDDNSEVDILYWVGCVSAYDKRKQKIAQSMAKILNASGLRWGILGTRECCTGDPARRLGEENLFQSQAKKNIKLLKQVKFKTLVASCPHCFNSIKNEYPDVDKNFLANNTRVIHHSHLLHELLEQNKILLSQPLEVDITYHDPCYLGRYNNSYDKPRSVLKQIQGTRLSEMSCSRDKAMCCGAGGGHYWFDMKKGDRINVLRVNQAKETKAQMIATGCPFCMQMIEDGVKSTNSEQELLVKDLAELVADALT